MGSGVSSERKMKNANHLKALQRLSMGMNQQQPQQQQSFHQAAHPYLNNGIPKQQRTGTDIAKRPTKMSLQLKPTPLSGKETTNGNAKEHKPNPTTTTATTTATITATTKPEGKLPTTTSDQGTHHPGKSCPNPEDCGDGVLKTNVQPQSQSQTMAKPVPVPVHVEGDADEAKKGEEDQPKKLEAQVAAGATKESETSVEVKEKVEVIKYDEEEREVKNKEFLDRVVGVLEKFSVVTVRDENEEGEPYTKDCRNNLLTFAKSYFYFKLGQVPYPFIFRYRQSVSRFLLEHKSVAKLCGIFEDGITRRTFVKEDGKMNTLQWLPLKNCMLTLLNYSDASDEVKLEIGTFSSLFGAIVRLLNDWQEDHIAGKLSDMKNQCLKWCMSICHNVGAMEENVPMMRENGVIQAFLPYLESPVSTMRLGAVATLADLVNEEEAELLQANVSIFKFILKTLKNSLSAENHKNLGWSAEELTRAIRQLARNDANKKILVDEGCLPLLVTLVGTGNEDEIKEAINGLWTLSFKPENKMRMVQEDGLVRCLEDKFNGTEDGSLRHACHGILWSLRDQINSPDSPVKVGEAVSNMVMKHKPGAASKASSRQFKGHVMVSYQWGNQELIKRIVHELRVHEVPVWLDIDYMGGSTLQAMAQAVEDSAVVIIAMSQKYKDSPNTRAEAEYAFQLRRKIIPLIMQRDYRPDGWLGFILGSKLYYDFSGRYSFESRMEGLLKAVLEVKEGSRTNTPVPELPVVASKKDPSFSSTSVLPPVGKSPAKSRSTGVTSPTFDLDAVKKWKADDKAKWLKKHGMPEYTKLSSLEGEEIAFLHNLKFEAPEFFYRCLDTKLGYSAISDLCKVSSALSDLSF